MRTMGLVGAVIALWSLAMAAHAQDAGFPVARPGATDALAMFDGVWIGPARMTRPDGSVSEFEQMERVGPMLAGEIRVMEGKARRADGSTMFNALTVFSPGEGGAIEKRSHIPGDVSSRTIQLKPDGYVWIATFAGGSMTYDITIRDGVWHETGVVTMDGAEPIPFFEMTLTRVGDTDWPAANPDFVTTD